MHLNRKLMHQFYLANAVELSYHEERLDLWGEYDLITDAEFIGIILPALLGGAKWKTLDLRRSGITITSIRALCQSGVIRSPHSALTNLCLGSINLADEGVEILVENLGSGPCNIRSLSLFDNRISDRGAAVLAKYVIQSNLKQLNLSNNIISDKGAEMLANAMKKSKLEHLTLYVNEITDHGAQALVAAFPASNLRYVGLRGNDDVGAFMRSKLSGMVDIAHSRWYQLAIHIMAPRLPCRLGVNSLLKMLPNELLRQVCLMIQDGDVLNPADLVAEPPKEQTLSPILSSTQTAAPSLDAESTDDDAADDESDLSDYDDDYEDNGLRHEETTRLSIEDRIERAGWQEDALACLAHDRRKWFFSVHMNYLHARLIDHMMAPAMGTFGASATHDCFTHFG